MKKFKVGDRVRIVPPAETAYIGMKATVLPLGGFGYESDDVNVMLDSGVAKLAKEFHLEKIMNNNKGHSKK